MTAVPIHWASDEQERMSVRESNSTSLEPYQYRLRTLLLWVFLIALGLTVATPHRDWQQGLLAIVAAAMTWGVVEEIVILSRLSASSHIPNHLRAKLMPSIAWRAGVALLFIITLVTLFLVKSELIQLPEFFTFPVFFYQIFPTKVFLMCIIVVLSYSKSRWSPKKPAATGSPWWLTVAAWIAGVALCLIVLPQVTVAHYMVHIATAGIEFVKPFQWQRQGTFPSHELEGYRLLWISVAAVVSVIASCALLVWVTRPRAKRTAIAILAGGSAGLLLSVAAGFDIWYYGWEYHRISPDFAAVGPMAGTWLSWLGAGILVFIAACAYGTRQCAEITLESLQGESRRWLQPRIHESWICLGFLGVWILWFGVELVTYMEDIGFVLSSINAYMDIAICILGIQLCWTRWHNRNKQANIGLYVISPARVLITFLGFLGLAIIGIPALAASCFNYWLGPW